MTEYLKLLENLYPPIEKVLDNHEKGITITKLIDEVLKKVKENGNISRISNKQSIRDAIISMAKDGLLQIERREPKTLFILKQK